MAEGSRSRSLDRLIVRLPDGVRDRIAARAKANGRSMNSEVVAILISALDNVDVRYDQRLRHEYYRTVRELKAMDQARAVMIVRRDALRAGLQALPTWQDTPLVNGPPEEE